MLSSGISYWTYLVAALLYTGYVFIADAPWVFLKKNTVPAATIIAVHSGFIALVLALLKLTSLAYPFMADWMTATSSRSHQSLLTLLLLIVGILLQKIETGFIYRESPARD
jgi:hypothetical protein